MNINKSINPKDNVFILYKYPDDRQVTGDVKMLSILCCPDENYEYTKISSDDIIINYH